MNIRIIEDNIDRVLDINIASIIELIIDAIRTYPQYELNDTEAYCDEIKKLLKSNEINLQKLKNFQENIYDLGDQKSIWIMDSINSLVEAFELMRLHNIPFNEVKNTIEALK